MMDRPGHLVVAYHGCDAGVRDALLAPGGVVHVNESNNPYDWLGTGAYFMEDDWERALLFAQAASEVRALTKGRIDEPAVVGVVLRIHRWLDLTTQDGKQAYVDAHRTLTQRGTKLPPNKRAHENDLDMILRPTDRKVINEIHRMRDEQGLPPYHAVRSFFPQGEELALTSGFKRDTHVQLALRDSSCVLGYFRVREAEVMVDVP